MTSSTVNTSNDFSEGALATFLLKELAELVFYWAERHINL